MLGTRVRSQGQCSETDLPPCFPRPRKNTTGIHRFLTLLQGAAGYTLRARVGRFVFGRGPTRRARRKRWGWQMSKNHAAVLFRYALGPRFHILQAGLQAWREGDADVMTQIVPMVSCLEASAERCGCLLVAEAIPILVIDELNVKQTVDRAGMLREADGYILPPIEYTDVVRRVHHLLRGAHEVVKEALRDPLTGRRTARPSLTPAPRSRPTARRTGSRRSSGSPGSPTGPTASCSTSPPSMRRSCRTPRW